MKSFLEKNNCKDYQALAVIESHVEFFLIKDSKIKTNYSYSNKILLSQSAVPPISKGRYPDFSSVSFLQGIYDFLQCLWIC